MNTNKLHFVVILMIAMFTASCKDDIDHTIITPEQLPEKTTTFLAKYFQDDDIISGILVVQYKLNFIIGIIY